MPIEGQPEPFGRWEDGYPAAVSAVSHVRSLMEMRKWKVRLYSSADVKSSFTYGTMEGRIITGWPFVVMSVLSSIDRANDEIWRCFFRDEQTGQTRFSPVPAKIIPGLRIACKKLRKVIGQKTETTDPHRPGWLKQETKSESGPVRRDQSAVILSGRMQPAATIADRKHSTKKGRPVVSRHRIAQYKRWATGWKNRQRGEKKQAYCNQAGCSVKELNAALQHFRRHRAATKSRHKTHVKGS